MKNKNLFKLLTLCIIMLFFCNINLEANAATEPIIVVNGDEITADAAPYISDSGRTMVPVRFVSEPLGAYVDWNNDTKVATISRFDTVIEITIGSSTALVNGVEYELDSPATAIDGRTFLPLRFIGEHLDCDVYWDTTDQAVYITTKTIVENTPPEVDEENMLPEDEDTGYYNPDFQYLGYYYSSSSLGNTIDFKNELTGAIHFAYSIESDGSITAKDNFSADNFHAEEGGFEAIESVDGDTYMLVTGFYSSVISAVLNSEENRAKAISEIIEILDEYGFDGIDLDFEAVGTSQRENFVTFVKELREAVGDDILISLSMMPRSTDSQTWLDGYDYYGLSQYADYLILMAYNEHYSGGTAGPVASLDWVEKVINYTLEQGVDKSQIVVALGSYGYDWPDNSSGSSLTNTSSRSRAEQYGATIYRDPDSLCLYFTYTDSSGINHTVWFEDRISLASKAALAYEYDLGGIAFWRLGFSTDEIWSSILEATNHPNAEYWLSIAADVEDENFPLKSPDVSEDEVDIENNGTFVPQS